MSDFEEIVRTSFRTGLVDAVSKSMQLNFDGDLVAQVTVIYNDAIGRPTAAEMSEVASKLWELEVFEGSPLTLAFKSKLDTIEVEAA